MIFLYVYLAGAVVAMLYVTVLGIAESMEHAAGDGPISPLSAWLAVPLLCMAIWPAFLFMAFLEIEERDVEGPVSWFLKSLWTIRRY